MALKFFTSWLVLGTLFSSAAALNLQPWTSFFHWKTAATNDFGYQGCGPCTQIEPGFYPNWMAVHDGLAKELQEAEAAGGWDLVFFGDSITETWRGTEIGNKPCWNDRCRGVPEVFDRYFGSVYKSGVLAIGGDQVYHQLWRMQNGELPTHPRVAVVLIGTNDLGYSECGQGESAISAAAVGTALRIRDLLEFMAEKLPKTHVVLLGVLPRGQCNDGMPFIWPSEFTTGIQTINALLTEFGKHNPLVTYLNCGKRFVQPGGGLKAELFEEGIHPNAAGMEELAKCLTPLVAQFMGNSAPRNGNAIISTLAAEA